MEEKRKSKRSDLNSRLIMKRLDGTESKEVDIEIEDISKAGVGFRTEQVLTIGAVYEGYLTIWTKEVIHVFMEIVRIEKKDDIYVYGAIFVGMPGMDAARIETYQTIEESKE